MGIHDTERDNWGVIWLKVTTGEQWELIRLRDYWSLMRPMGSHETQKDKCGRKRLRLLDTHETQRD